MFALFARCGFPTFDLIVTKKKVESPNINIFAPDS